MAQVKILLVDLDAEYLSALEQCFINEFLHSAELSVITDLMYLKQYFSSPRTFDILLINETLYSKEITKHNIAHTFILTEEMPDPRDTGVEFSKKIYKYSGAKEILHYVMSRSGISGATNLHSGVAKLVSVFSPIGGAGQTTVAAGLCAALSRNFHRVLYVGLDGLQSFGFLINGNQRLAGVEKTLVSKSQYAYNKVKPLIVSGLFDMLPPFEGSLASLGLSIEHMRYLIDKIKHSGDYDFIVIDCANDFTAETAQTMADSDHVVLITLQDTLSVRKFQCLLDNIDVSDAARFVLVCNKFNHKAEHALAGLNLTLETIEETPAMDPRRSEELALVQGVQKLSQTFV